MAAGRNWRGGEAGTTMPACEKGAAPGRARPRAGGGHLYEGEARWLLAMWEQLQPEQDRRQEADISGRGKRAAGWHKGRSPSEGATMGRKGPSLGEGRAMAGSRTGSSCSEGKAAGSNLSSHGQGTAMPACGEGTPRARDRDWPSQVRGTAMLAGEELAAPATARRREVGGHHWEGEEGCRLAKRE